MIYIVATPYAPSLVKRGTEVLQLEVAAILGYRPIRGFRLDSSIFSVVYVFLEDPFPSGFGSGRWF